MKTFINYKGQKIEGSMGYDSHGRMIFRSSNEIDNKIKPFDDIGFITIDKTDAENILSMLNDAIIRLESGKRQDNDVEVFGDRAISYERLCDYLDGVKYYEK